MKKILFIALIALGCKKDTPSQPLQVNAQTVTITIELKDDFRNHDSLVWYFACANAVLETGGYITKSPVIWTYSITKPKDSIELECVIEQTRYIYPEDSIESFTVKENGIELNNQAGYSATQIYYIK